MKFLQSLSAQVSLRTQGAILALGLLFIILDALTEPMNPAIDLAWVTVIICGLPLLINSVQSILDHLEIHANFLIVIAMVALIAIGDYHTAAYVGLIVHGGFFLEQLITGDVHYTLLVALRQGINNYSSVIVVAVMLLSMGSYALTQNFMHTITLLVILCPCSLELVLVALMMGSLVDENSPTAGLSKEAKQCHLGLLIVSILFHVAIIGAGVLGSINPVTAAALHGLARLGLVYNLKVFRINN
ncbi:MAG: hypothetical protein E7I16_05560 [Veillonella sp.]|nr:hypothetical protein [Veillonella sp.]